MSYNPSAYLGTIGWNDNGDPDGFSETYWIKKGEGDNLSIAMDKLLLIYPKRRALMCNDISVSFLRVSDPGVRGDSIVVKPLPGIGEPPSFNDLASGAAADSKSLPDGLVIDMYITNPSFFPTYRTVKPLHAIPSALLYTTGDDRNRKVKNVPKWEQLFTAFLNVYAANCSLVHRTPSYVSHVLDTQISPRNPLASVASSGDLITGDTVTGVGIQRGTRIVNIDGTTLVFNRGASVEFPSTQKLTYKHLDPAVPYVYAAVNITRITHNNQFTFRKVGGPFGRSRGRRSAKR